MKVYISGPIGCQPERARKKFKEAEAEVIDAGHTPVNPFDNGLPDNATWKQHMVKDIETLFDCDGIYILRGSEESKGARIEEFIAETLHMDIVYQP
jgi:hypothetical protein